MKDLYRVSIKPLDSGYVVKTCALSAIHRTAEPTLQGALTLAARALGYRGVIRFDEVPAMGTVAPEIGIPFDDEEPPLRAGTATKPDDLL